jgi:hypothetical protein
MVRISYVLLGDVLTKLFGMWQEVLSIAASLELSTEEDEHMWQYHSSGLLSPYMLS